jgi:hypothetical protein
MGLANGSGNGGHEPYHDRALLAGKSVSWSADGSTPKIHSD